MSSSNIGKFYTITSLLTSKLPKNTRAEMFSLTLPSGAYIISAKIYFSEIENDSTTGNFYVYFSGWISEQWIFKRPNEYPLNRGRFSLSVCTNITTTTKISLYASQEFSDAAINVNDYDMIAIKIK